MKNKYLKLAEFCLATYAGLRNPLHLPEGVLFLT